MLKLASKPGSIAKVQPFVEKIVSRYKVCPNKKHNPRQETHATARRLRIIYHRLSELHLDTCCFCFSAATGEASCSASLKVNVRLKNQFQVEATQ